MNDDDVKKVVLAVQQQQQLPSEQNYVGGVVGAVPVQVMNGHCPQQQQQQAGAIIHHYVVSSPTPSVGMNHAAHPHQCQCCYPLTVDDPVEVAQARAVAITHICVEVVGIFFCDSGWCGPTPLLGVVSSSLVACCCKTPNVYRLWSLVGVLLFVMHAVAAIKADPERLPVLFYSVYITLGGVSLLVACLGWKTASATRGQPIIRAGGQIGTPSQLPMQPVAGGQQLPVIHVMP